MFAHVFSLSLYTHTHTHRRQNHQTTHSARTCAHTQNIHSQSRTSCHHKKLTMSCCLFLPNNNLQNLVVRVSPHQTICMSKRLRNARAVDEIFVVSFLASARLFDEIAKRGGHADSYAAGAYVAAVACPPPRGLSCGCGCGGLVPRGGAPPSMSRFKPDWLH